MADLTGKIDKGDRIYLLHETKKKFWEVTNSGKENSIRYGRWTKGSEGKVINGARKYESYELALNRAMEIIISKKDKGYILFRRENIDKGRVNNSFTSIISRNMMGDTDIEIELE